MASAERFGRCVLNRDRYDVLINGSSLLFLLVMPVFAGLIVYFYVRAYGIGEQRVMMVPLVFEALIIGIILYKLYARMSAHAKRDREWRDSLIEYARESGADVGGMIAADRDARSIDVFLMRYPVAAILIIGGLAVVYLFFFFAPSTSSGMNTATSMSLAIAISITLIGLVFVGISFKAIMYPSRHERRQERFIAEFRRAMSGINGNIRYFPRTVRHRSLLVHIILLLIFNVFYATYLGIFMVRGMNAHIRNQWFYESNLVRSLATGGERGFEGFPEVEGDSSRKRRKARKRYDRMMRDIVKEINRMPASLIIAELFLVVMCAVYILKLSGIFIDIGYDPGTYSLQRYIDGTSSWWGISGDLLLKMFTVLMDTVMVYMVIDSIMGLASRRARSWKKVVRTCVTFTVPTWLSAFVFSSTSYAHMFDFNPFITTAVLYDILLMMVLSMPIKRYYTPDGFDIPPTRRWVRYAVSGNLVDDGDAGAVFGDDVTDTRSAEEVVEAVTDTPE